MQTIELTASITAVRERKSFSPYIPIAHRIVYDHAFRAYSYLTRTDSLEMHHIASRGYRKIMHKEREPPWNKYLQSYN